tara:strand:- start:276 stop:569 length:294 start_codon:yes stop_codon:yes gene_type:complete
MKRNTLQQALDLFVDLNSNGLCLDSRKENVDDIEEIYTDKKGMLREINFKDGTVLRRANHIHVEFSGCDIGYQVNWLLISSGELRAIYSIKNENGAE